MQVCSAATATSGACLLMLGCLQASHAKQHLQAALRLTIHRISIYLKSCPNAGLTLCLVITKVLL